MCHFSSDSMENLMAAFTVHATTLRGAYQTTRRQSRLFKSVRFSFLDSGELRIITDTSPMTFSGAHFCHSCHNNATRYSIECSLTRCRMGT